MVLTAQQKRERATRAAALMVEMDGPPTPAPVPEKSPVAGKREASIRPEPFVRDLVPPEKWPKKYPNPGMLKVGDSVWYRGERHWIDYVPTSWSYTCFIRICSERIRPGNNPPKNSEYFYVPADCVDLAPQAANPYLKQPTKADIARKERTTNGQRDIGDPVAGMLRAASSTDELYRIAASYLGCPEDDLRRKYAHLNPGQQRMLCGNRMRAKWKKENK